MRSAKTRTKKKAPTTTRELNNRELGTVLAALRVWQWRTETGNWPDARHFTELLDIATDGNMFDMLCGEEIDQLCEDVNGATQARIVKSDARQQRTIDVLTAATFGSGLTMFTTNGVTIGPPEPTTV